MFAGVSRGALLAAGGANFPGKKPWDGGAKVWYDRVFVLERPDGAWREAGRLRRPLGYGVSVSHPSGVICAGGSDADRHYRECFRLEWTGDRLRTTPLPPLPRPIANGCGALVENALYVAGGQEAPASGHALVTVYRLDLGAAPPRWERVTDLPGPGRIFATAAALEGDLYVVGGAELVTVNGRTGRRYLRDAYRYRPGSGWERLADLPHSVVAAPTPAPAAPGGFAVLGGDDGSQVETPPDRHPGFRKTVLLYDRESGRWTDQGELPAPRVTVPCVKWRGLWVVPSGEMRPGVRSPQVWGLPAP